MKAALCFIADAVAFIGESVADYISFTLFDDLLERKRRARRNPRRR